MQVVGRQTLLHPFLFFGWPAGPSGPSEFRLMGVENVLRRGSIAGGLRAPRAAWVWRALLIGVCAFAIWAAVGARRTTPVVETVTTGVRAPVSAPTPVYFTPILPAPDADVEQAGDRIAEAEVYLKKRQSVAALAALNRARHATTRALEARQHKGSRSDVLSSTLKGLDAVERAIRRGALEDAHRQLVALDKNLDNLDY
jgi:hypothetical protein